MVEQGILNSEDQPRHVKDCGSRLDEHGRELPDGRTFVHPTRLMLERPEIRGREGIRAKRDPERDDSEDESLFGPEDGHHGPEEKELLHWPKPALRDTPTSPSAAGSVRYNRVPPTAELAVHIPGDTARAAAQRAKRLEAIQNLKDGYKKRREAEAAAAWKPTSSSHTNAGETVKVVDNDDIPGQAPVYQRPPGWPSHRPWVYFHSPTNRGWALLEMKEEKERRLSKRQVTTKPQQQTASQPPRSRLPPHLRVIEEAKQAEREAAAKLEQRRPPSQPEQGGPTPTAGGPVLDPDEDIYGVWDDEERRRAVKAKKPKDGKTEDGQVSRGGRSARCYRFPGPDLGSAGGRGVG
ncbi:hypothetical protein DL766_002356 [Monosporascus sp. MC13-8B]|uniref:CBF1-interacting co-repressor CIR N-terminal domain-containing protein n=1 Tax=Monosporascus cannonballus TaxID=155416 RepID=A0ABY0HFW2_9PEZI|nr:hypothetical protein DL762_001597 [Monosporascus cannonballus]RYP00286.1 hypothetical protein DL763_000897 [Monosporascus cannonballus]RYP35703.1 hypothetical protein DL766_002356 [Monosporascus sp. MC13-8B]